MVSKLRVNSTYKGKKYYFDANSGEAVTNRFIQISWCLVLLNACAKP